MIQLMSGNWVFNLSSGLGSKYESFVKSVLFKPPYTTYFWQRKNNNHFCIKPIPVWLLLVNNIANFMDKTTMVIKCRGGRGRGGWGQWKGDNNNQQGFESRGRGFFPSGFNDQCVERGATIIISKGLSLMDVGFFPLDLMLKGGWQ